MFRNIENKFEKSDCVRAIYGDSDIPGSVTVENSALTGVKPNQVLKGIDGYAYQKDGKSGNLTVSLNNLSPSSPLRILSTDYNSYAIVYGCSHILGVKRYEFIWVLTREALVRGS